MLAIFIVTTRMNAPWQGLPVQLNSPPPDTPEGTSQMQKLIFAAAVAVAAIPLQAATTADPDVNKLPAGPEKAVVAEV